MSTWHDGLLEAMTEYVQRKHGPDSLAVTNYGYTPVDLNVVVTDYEDTSGWSGGCETCEYYDAEVTLTLPDGSTKRYPGSFGDLISDLT